MTELAPNHTTRTINVMLTLPAAPVPKTVMGNEPMDAVPVALTNTLMSGPLVGLALKLTTMPSGMTLTTDMATGPVKLLSRAMEMRYEPMAPSRVNPTEG